MPSDELVDADVVEEEHPAAPPGRGDDDDSSSAWGCGCLALLVTVLAIIPGGCGMYWSAAAQRDHGEITIAEAKDRQATPSGTFVVLNGTPDPQHAAEIVGEGDDVGTVLLTLQGAPTLVIACRADHPLAEAVRDSSSAEALKQLDRQWTFEGRLIDGGDYMPDIPSFQLYRYITEHLKLEDEADARVLIVGETARSWLTRSRWGYGFAVALGLLALVGWIMTFRFWLASRGGRNAR